MTGSANQLDLPPLIEAAVRRALTSVAATTSALVVTGGTNSGVMVSALRSGR